MPQGRATTTFRTRNRNSQ